MDYIVPLPTLEKDIEEAIFLWNEYKEECKESGEKPDNFRDWYDTTYYYDYMDNKD